MKTSDKTQVGRFPKPASMEVARSLTKPEKEKLAKLEEVVERHVKSFFEVVEAMRTIKVEKLWRADYDSWEDYVERKWKMSRQHSYRLVDAAEIIVEVQSVTQGDTKAVRLPTNERAYREIKELTDKAMEPKQMVELLKRADTYTGSTRDIEPGDIQKAAVALKLVTKPKRAAFELKVSWEEIRDGLAALLKVLRKHKELKEQTTQLEGLLAKAREAVKQCPPPKPKKKTEPKVNGKGGDKPAGGRPGSAKRRQAKRGG